MPRLSLLRRVLGASFSVLAMAGATPAFAGALVVSHSPNILVPVSVGVTVSDPAPFSRNLVRLLDRDTLTGGRVLVFNPGAFLGNASNIADTPFAQAVAPLGYVLDVATPDTPIDAATLGQYDVVMLSGFLAAGDGSSRKDDSVLAAYVAGGGGLYVAGSNLGFGGARGDMASYYNSLLDDFGIAFEAELHNRAGVLGGMGALFDRGATTGFINGYDLSLTGTEPRASLVQQARGQAADEGLIAVFEAPDRPVAQVSAPGGLALTALGLALLGGAGRRRRGA